MQSAEGRVVNKELFKKYKVIIYIFLLLLAGFGAFLYIASYFFGIIFIILSITLYYLFHFIIKGRESVLKDITSALKKLLIPIIGILVAIFIGAVIMILTGYNPVTAYGALFYGGFIKNWHVSLLNAAPLIFTGLSVAFAFKAGLFNIGAEGQYYIGAMAAAALGLYLNWPPFLTIPVIFILAGIAGALYNYIPSLLKVKTGAHEVITTMMFAHIARYCSSIFIRGFGGDPATSSHPYVTDPIPASHWLLRFKDILPEANYRLHIGIIIAILVAFFVHYILTYTKIGFEIRAVGSNPDAARTMGISVGKNIFIALMFAGFLAGLAGVNQVLGLEHKMYENLSAGYGWNGISVALLASNHPIGVIFTSILWGALDSGGQYMARTQSTHNSIVEIIKGIVLFLVVARYLYTYFGQKFRKKGKKNE
ncbi:MAG: ABC transporter permease [Spirochaetales bacterium]|nr:ABC transporter permease [Spirochaetales bacterium]